MQIPNVIQNRTILTPTAETCAYFAGYFDAEGCIAVYPANGGRNWVAVVSFGQTQPVVLEQLHTIYGGTFRRVQQNARWRVRTDWHLRRYGAVACFLTDVLPYLGEKHDQAQAVLDRFSSGMKTSELADDLRRMKQQRLQQTLPITRHHRTDSCSECERPSRARGFCTLHYQRAKKAGLHLINPRRSARQFSYKRLPSKTDKAYIAGYFDGDGYIGLTRQGTTWHLEIYFNQTRADAVLRMFEIYDGSLKRRKVAPPRRPQVAYQIGARNAVLKFLHDVRPYLLEKRAQVDAILDHYDPRMENENAQRLQKTLHELRWAGAHLIETPTRTNTRRTTRKRAPAGVYQFNRIVRREGVRGRRISIPAPVVRALHRMSWNRKMPLHLTVDDVAWTATARRMGNAVVVALPVDCLGTVGEMVTLKLWQGAPVVRD